MTIYKELPSICVRIAVKRRETWEPRWMCVAVPDLRRSHCDKFVTSGEGVGVPYDFRKVTRPKHGRESPTTASQNQYHGTDLTYWVYADHDGFDERFEETNE